jgi:uncharacterized protein (DUF433 family)
VIEKRQNLTGLGIYSVPDASRLTHVSPQRIRRWLKGYSFASSGKALQSPPVWQGQIEPIEGQVAVGFLDLIEIQYVEAFLRNGVSWKTIRIAEEHARRAFKTDHPFCTQKFKTDGCTILADLVEETGEKKMLDIAELQQVFRAFVEPFVLTLDFVEDKAVRWWPMGNKKTVVLDPSRCFGQPIVALEGVPTLNLVMAFRKNKSVGDVAKWHEVSERSVRDAIAFEEKWAA